jgi:hypothetical protein
VLNMNIHRREKQSRDECARHGGKGVRGATMLSGIVLKTGDTGDGKDRGNPNAGCEGFPEPYRDQDIHQNHFHAHHRGDDRHLSKRQREDRESLAENQEDRKQNHGPEWRSDGRKGGPVVKPQKPEGQKHIAAGGGEESPYPGTSGSIEKQGRDGLEHRGG